jgi:hypothetical protein
MRKISRKKELQIRRWLRETKVIHALDNEELRQLTPEDRLRQLYILMDLAKSLKIRNSTPAEDKEVRRRWKKIHDAQRATMSCRMVTRNVRP